MGQHGLTSTEKPLLFFTCDELVGSLRVVVTGLRRRHARPHARHVLEQPHHQSSAGLKKITAFDAAPLTLSKLPARCGISIHPPFFPKGNRRTDLAARSSMPGGRVTGLRCGFEQAPTKSGRSSARYPADSFHGAVESASGAQSRAGFRRS